MFGYLIMWLIFECFEQCASRSGRFTSGGVPGANMTAKTQIPFRRSRNRATQYVSSQFIDWTAESQVRCILVWPTFLRRFANVCTNRILNANRSRDVWTQGCTTFNFNEIGHKIRKENKEKGRLRSWLPNLLGSSSLELQRQILFKPENPVTWSAESSRRRRRCTTGRDAQNWRIHGVHICRNDCSHTEYFIDVIDTANLVCIDIPLRNPTGAGYVLGTMPGCGNSVSKKKKIQYP